MKKLPIVLLLVLCLFTSCVEWEKEQDRSYFLLSETGKAVELSCPEICDTYKWYKCSNENGDNAIEVGSARAITTDSFASPDIYYYKCEGYTNGSVAYTSPVLYVFYTGLPTVYLNTTDSKEIKSKRDYTEASITIADNKNPLETQDITVKGRGSSSWILMPKKSYTVKFDSKTKVLGMSKGKKWCLTANYIDTTKIGNWYAAVLGKDVFNTSLDKDTDVWQAESKSVNLIVNGEYRGLYNVTEAIKIDSKRIDISDISEINVENLEDDFNEDGKVSIDDGGFLVEFTSDTDGTSFCTLRGLTVTFKDPDLDEIKGSFSYAQIKDHVRKEINLLECSIFNETEKPYTDYINLDSMINWFLTNEFMANNEASFKTSSYLYYDPARGEFIMGPNWDFDRTLNYRDPKYVAVTDTLNTWYEHLITDPVFTTALKERWNSQKGALKDSFQKAVKQSDKIAIAAKVDGLRWDTAFTPSEDVEKWLKSRYEFMDSYINGL